MDEITEKAKELGYCYSSAILGPCSCWRKNKPAPGPKPSDNHTLERRWKLVNDKPVECCSWEPLPDVEMEVEYIKNKKGEITHTIYSSPIKQN